MTTTTPAAEAAAALPSAIQPAAKLRKKPAPTTMQTLKRLKAMLQARINKLEEEIKALGLDIDAVSSERGVRTTNTLVRTLEKVLELEHKDRKARKLRKTTATKLDDTGRQELAKRIAKLSGQSDGAECELDANTDTRVAERLAPLGETGSTSATA